MLGMHHAPTIHTWRATQKKVILSRISRFDLHGVRILIAGSSKCDFRNLGKILSGYIFFSKNNIFFSWQKFSRRTFSDFFWKKKFEEKNHWKSIYFFGFLENRNFKILKNQNFQKFSKFWNFRYSDFQKCQKKKLFSPKKYFLSRKFLFWKKNVLKKKYFFFEKNIYPLRISPRFRKSHLEDPAIIIRTLRRSKRAKSAQDSYLLGGSSHSYKVATDTVKMNVSESCWNQFIPREKTQSYFLQKKSWKNI